MLRIARSRFGGNVVRNGHDPKEAVDKAYEQFFNQGLDALASENRHQRLAQIVLRRAIDMCKRRDATEPLPEHDAVAEMGEDDDAFRRVEDRIEVADLLSRLKPRERDVIERHYIEDQSTEEIAKALNIGDRRVRQILQDVRTRFGRTREP